MRSGVSPVSPLTSLAGVAKVDGVLREMRLDDVAVVLDVQEPAAVVGLAEVFPQDRFPFPRDAIGKRWRDEITDPDIDCFVMLRSGTVVGFAALRQDEVLHFGVALGEWGSGLAVAGHDELVERIRRTTRTRPWLSVYSANRRGRAFWEKLGWAATGEHSRGDGPPHAELVTYELRPESNWFSP